MAGEEVAKGKSAAGGRNSPLRSSLVLLLISVSSAISRYEWPRERK
jgi:hypothetical protein